MTAEQLTAVVGLSAGAGSAVGWWAANWWRDRVPAGEQWIIRRIYKSVDDLIGATKDENQNRADRRRRIIYPRAKGWRTLLYLIPRTAREWWANYREPIPRIGPGVNPLPEVERMAVWVPVQFRWERPWWGIRRQTYHLWDVEAVTVYWTTEAAALSSDGDDAARGFARNVGRKVAQALRMASVDQLTWTVDYDAGCIRYTRKPAARQMRTDVPHEVGVDA